MSFEPTKKHYKLFDYINKSDSNEFKKWTEGLQKKQIAKLNQKLDKLEISGDELMPQLLTDSNVPGVKKLRITVQNVQLRPLLCNGPVNNDKEYTLLMGAKEIGDKWHPKKAPETALKKLKEITRDPENRRRKHERVN